MVVGRVPANPEHVAVHENAEVARGVAALVSELPVHKGHSLQIRNASPGDMAAKRVGEARAAPTAASARPPRNSIEVVEPRGELGIPAGLIGLLRRMQKCHEVGEFFDRQLLS